ncbi:hypothetical protein Trydic_g13015 [Trypoxylus dichotomus]
MNRTSPGVDCMTGCIDRSLLCDGVVVDSTMQAPFPPRLYGDELLRTEPESRGRDRPTNKCVKSGKENAFDGESNEKSSSPHDCMQVTANRFADIIWLFSYHARLRWKSLAGGRLRLYTIIVKDTYVAGKARINNSDGIPYGKPQE